MKAILLLFLVTALWGTTFPLQKMVLEGVSPFVFNALRFWIATIVAFALGGKQNFKYGIILGLFMAAGYVTQTWGLSLTTASKSGFITSLYIIIVPILSFFFDRERVNRIQLIGFTLAFVGSYFISGGLDGFSMGDFLTLICSVAFAFHVVWITRISRKVSEKELLGWQFAVVAVINSFLGANSSWSVPIQAWMVALYCAVLASILAVFWQLKFQKRVGNNTSALIFVGEPIFAAFFAYFILGETLTRSQSMGAVFLTISLILVSFKPQWISKNLWYTSNAKSSKRRV